jgi:hypothetical protein
VKKLSPRRIKFPHFVPGGRSLAQQLHSTQRFVVVLPPPAIAFDLDGTFVVATPMRPRTGDYFVARVGRRTVFVRQRRGLSLFLDRVQKLDDVFFFTASSRDYANQTIDGIAPVIRPCRRFGRSDCYSCLAALPDVSSQRKGLSNNEPTQGIEKAQGLNKKEDFRCNALNCGLHCRSKELSMATAFSRKIPSKH